MLIIPEIKCVILQPPRTGSTSMRDAVLARYPLAFTPYRHMERDGIPAGYETFSILCAVRHPHQRLASLYRYMKKFSSTTARVSQEWRDRMSSDVSRPFADWLAQSQEVFTDPVDHDGTFIPRYLVSQTMPIARKSQWFWARPDMGPVELLKLEDTKATELRLDLKLDHANQSQVRAEAPLCAAARRHLEQHHKWDLEIYES